MKSEVNLADPLTKPLGKKLIFETIEGNGTWANLEINSDGNPIYVDWRSHEVGSYG